MLYLVRSASNGTLHCTLVTLNGADLHGCGPVHALNAIEASRYKENGGENGSHESYLETVFQRSMQFSHNADFFPVKALIYGNDFQLHLYSGAHK